MAELVGITEGDILETYIYARDDALDVDQLDKRPARNVGLKVVALEAQKALVMDFRDHIQPPGSHYGAPELYLKELCVKLGVRP